MQRHGSSRTQPGTAPRRASWQSLLRLYRPVTVIKQGRQPFHFQIEPEQLLFIARRRLRAALPPPSDLIGRAERLDPVTRDQVLEEPQPRAELAIMRALFLAVHALVGVARRYRLALSRLRAGGPRPRLPAADRLRLFRPPFRCPCARCAHACLNSSFGGFWPVSARRAPRAPGTGDGACLSFRVNDGPGVFYGFMGGPGMEGAVSRLMAGRADQGDGSPSG